MASSSKKQRIWQAGCTYPPGSAIPFFPAIPAGTIGSMLRRTIQRTLVIAGTVAALSMLTLSLVPPGTLGTIQLHEGYYVGHRVSLWTNWTHVALTAQPYSMCDVCGGMSIGPLVGPLSDHTRNCPRRGDLSLTLVEDPFERWLSIPGLQIRIDEDHVFGCAMLVSLQFLAFLFAIFPAVTLFLWFRARRRIPPGHCTKCSYNLTGNTSGVCPECGTPTVPRP